MSTTIRYANLVENRVSQCAEEVDRHELAYNIAYKIHSASTKPSSNWESFPESDDKIDDLSNRFSDVWIMGIANHVNTYSATFAAPSLEIADELPQEGIIQKSKSFSGDVSGVIGETLFTVIAGKFLGLQEHCFVHLRPFKGQGQQPDFGIYLPSDILLDRFRAFDLNTYAVLPIPCEVKAISTTEFPQPATIRDRLSKAMSQLQSFWSFQNMTETGETMGLICVAIRNPHESSYDVSLIWCN